jgi:UDPglucose--hexose-1-phosphate uridylyltransferase
MPHAHTQLIALPVTPIVVKEKLTAARAYYLEKDRNLFEDILKAERKAGDRVVFENDGFTVFCPFASRFPFETCVMPRKQSADFQNSTDEDLLLLAEAVQRTLGAYAEALNRPNYNLVLHTAPFRRSRHPEAWTTLDADFRWHIEILPRLTGVAGFEFGTGFYINPTLPEEAAARPSTTAMVRHASSTELTSSRSSPAAKRCRLLIGPRNASGNQLPASGTSSPGAPPVASSR